MQTHMLPLYSILLILFEQLRQMNDGEGEEYLTEKGVVIGVGDDDDVVEDLLGLAVRAEE